MPIPHSTPARKPGTADKLTWVRPVVQISFVLASVLIGLQFHAFVKSIADQTGAEVAYRPPAVEGYLPISSLMSLVYLFKTGAASPVHPAGLVIFSLVLVLTVAIRRGFCSWVCPIGSVSEYLHRFGRRMLGRNLLMPGWMDVTLRGIKYLLLAFVAVAIVRMPATGLEQFLNGPYNRVADVKMYLFFADISRTGVIVIGVLAGLSILIKNFWCRYLCPYGALLSLLSMLSPTRVTRNAERCTGCGACTRACPNRIQVQKESRVCSGECTACYSCADACPSSGALEVRTLGNRGLSKLAYAVAVIAAFYFAGETAAALGYWHGDTTAEMYRALYQIIPSLGHPRGI